MGLGAIISVNNKPAPELTKDKQVEYIEVYERLGETTFYTIKFEADIENKDIPRLTDKKIDAGSELSIIIPSKKGLPECLVKGPIYSQQIHLQHGGECSWVEVMGADSSIKMDREFKSKVWPDGSTDGAAVSSIVTGYKLVPKVDLTKTPSVHIGLKHNLIQRSSDLQFVRKLARRNGCQFWITCNAVGIETAHFQRPNLQLPSAIELIINKEQCNIDAMDILWNVERPTSVIGSQLDLSTKAPLSGIVPKSPEPSLGKLNLQLITKDVRNTHVTAPVDDVADLRSRGQAALIEAGWFIRAKCKTTVKKLGKIARAHTLAKVTGAGSRHSGNYLIAAVKHRIDSVSHTMDIDLIRNGWEPSGLKLP